MLVIQHLLSIILSSFLIASTIAQWSPNYPVAMMAERRPFTEETIKATVFLFGSESDVVGHLVLTQQGEDEPLIIQGKIKGLSRGTKHGFHVHQYGDVFTEGCDSTGTHYNPLGASHGGPHGGERHVGDLGNIEADSYGVATVKMVDSVIRLTGPHSIIGRAFVVHEKEDDLTTTANPGKRLACGTIALSK